MHVLVFTNNSRLSGKLGLRRRKGLVDEVSYAALKDFSTRLKALNGPTLCYLDVSSLDEAKIAAHVRALARNGSLAFGIVDPARRIDDVGRLFHGGAVDYLDRRAIEKGLDAARLRKVCTFIRAVRPVVLEQAAVETRQMKTASYRPSGCGWEAVIPGKEYTFCIMFIELDGKEQMERNYGLKNLSIALASFRSYIDGFVRQFGGRIWMWSGFGGLVLFPFDAKSCPALICSFRLMLFKHIYDIEGSHFPKFLSYRVVLHIGNILYMEENTGNIVSDSLNSIFHLGQQFARPGGFYVTDEVMQFSHPALRGFFLHAGTFENRRVLRMRQPVHGAIGY